MNVARSKSLHAPMWVIRVQHVLEMTGRLQTHQFLKAANLLEIFMPMMYVMFVSHQWLSFIHPDPKGEQLKVLQEALKNLIAKRVKIDDDIASEFFSRKSIGKQLEGVRDWHMWLDYFSVPQQVEGHEGLAEEQLLYVNSIPSYVDRCQIFVALVPEILHHETSEACDPHTWLQRGWCRTELWSYYLSTRSKLPVIEVKSPHVLRFTMPLWHRYPVHTGKFAIEMDRTSCSHAIQAALAKHVVKLRKTKKAAYRLHCALFGHITGTASNIHSLDEFRSQFDFPKPLQQYKGLGPMACAALIGDEDLLRSVAEAKASVHTHAPAMPETLNCPDFEPLHLALWFRSHDLRIVEALLELRANPSSSTRNAPPPLGFCQTVGALDALVRRCAGVNFQGKSTLQLCPIHYVAGLGAPSEVTARLLELRADVCGGRGGLASASPLHLVAYSGDSKNDLRNAQLLVEKRADVNQILKPEGVFKMLEVMSRVYCFCRSNSRLLLKFFSQMSVTPLGLCAFLDNRGLLTFLLRASADPEIRGNTGLRPIDVARSEAARAILQDSRQYIYLLEHNSELVTETL